MFAASRFRVPRSWWLWARSWGAAIALLLWLPIAANAQSPDQLGQWGPVLDWGIQGKHMALQPTGKVLVWATGDNARVWDPATGNFTLTPATFGDLHCGAQATLADGRTIALGGVEVTPHIGIKVNGLFDPFSNSWSQGAPMNFARWYGTATTLADGRVLAASGDDQNSTRVALPEIYDPISNSWTVLSAAARDQILYPFMYLLPNGKIYEAGTRTSTNYLDLSGAGSWSPGPSSSFGSSGYAECGAMYAPGKILRSGGGDPAFANTAVIDTNAASPAWRDVAPMGFPRRRHNLVILADGQLLAVGGTRQADSESVAILAAELWNPATEQWNTVASMAEARMYHSASLLLPDGRVLSAGGEASGRLHAQIYSPPYLFQGARPTISASPVSTGYGSSFTVTTPNASSISSVALLRPGAVTHAIDMNQRYVPLAFSIGSGGLTVAAPANGNVAPPGYYMLVIESAAGVPSVAAWLRIDSTTNLSPGTILGRVTNASTGAGIAGASVSYSGGSTTSNTSGNYQLSNVPPGDHRVTAAKNGFANAEHNALVTAGSNVTLNFSLAAPGALSGRVTDATNGQALTGVTVAANGSSVLSNASGDFDLTGLAAGVVQVSFAATGFHSQDRALTILPNQTTNGDTALTPLDPRILGEVRDAQTDQPLAGASVSYGGEVTTADALGRYVFTDVIPGIHVVTASSSNFASFTQPAFVSDHTWTTLDFRLVSSGPLVLSVPASADAHVNSASLTKNYGTLSSLRVRAPSSGSEYRSYLRFDVPILDGPLLAAELRLFVNDESPSSGNLYAVGSGWSESGITWSNAPTLPVSPLASAVDAPAGSWLSFDVSSVVTGTGSHSFALASLSSNSVYYDSREATNDPVLVLNVDAGDPPPLPTIFGFAPQSGPVGTPVVIDGANFEEVTSLSFGGVPAPDFSVFSPTQIEALVPVGASSGPISVGNQSGVVLSSSRFTVEAPQISHFSFAPTDDAHVNSGSAARNYGSVAQLRARDSSSDYRFFAKFDVAGLTAPVQRATLRLFVTDGSPVGGALYGVSNHLLGTSTPWLETSLTWNTAPPLAGVAVSSLGTVTAGTWVEFDVTPLVTGNGSVGFGVSSSSTNSVYYDSKEGAQRPELIVDTAPAP